MGARDRGDARSLATRWGYLALCLVVASPWLVPLASARFRGKGGRTRIVAPRGEEAPYAGVVMPSIWVPIATTERRYGDEGVRWSVTLCLVDYDLYWREPHAISKFTNLQQKSGCGAASRRREVRLADAAREARAAAAPLRPSAFIFHESRVGSTLAANLLAAVPHHLVYSEGMRLPESRRASRRAALDAVRDYVALLGSPTTADGARSPHTKLFIKFQSAVSARMVDVLDAFPDVPWLFVHRDPVQVMMSHGARGFGRAVCVAKQRRAPPAVCSVLHKPACDAAPHEDYCAAHLAHLCDGAIAAAKAHATCGRILQYDTDMAATLVDDVIPTFFGVDVDADARRAMLATATRYSKGHEAILGASRDFSAEGDVARKARAATAAAQAASDAYLAPRHAELAALAAALDGSRTCAPLR